MSLPITDPELELQLGQLTGTITHRWAFWYDGLKSRGWSSEGDALVEVEKLKEQGFKYTSAPFRESDRIPAFCLDRKHVEGYLAASSEDMRIAFSNKLAARFKGRRDMLTAVMTCRPRVLAEVLYDTLTAVTHEV